MDFGHSPDGFWSVTDGFWSLGLFGKPIEVSLVDSINLTLKPRPVGNPPVLFQSVEYGLDLLDLFGMVTGVPPLPADQGKDFDLIGMPTTITELKSLEPFEFQNWVINEMRAKQSKKLRSDFGLDGYYDKTIFTDPAGIQVKQSEHIGRNVVDNFETALKRAKYDKGYIVAFSFGKGACEEAARVKKEGIDIRLVEVDDLLHGKFKV